MHRPLAVKSWLVFGAGFLAALAIVAVASAVSGTGAESAGSLARQRSLVDTGYDGTVCIPMRHDHEFTIGTEVLENTGAHVDRIELLTFRHRRGIRFVDARALPVGGTGTHVDLGRGVRPRFARKPTRNQHLLHDSGEARGFLEPGESELLIVTLRSRNGGFAGPLRVRYDNPYGYTKVTKVSYKIAKQCP